MFNPPQRVRFGEQTPPAIFPSILGLLGLGLAWRRAVPVFQAPEAVPQLILGAVSLLFVFALAAYARKVVKRPGVVVEDLRVLPGAAGLAAMTMSLVLMSAVMVTMNRGAAEALLWLGLGGHGLLALLTLRALWAGPPEQRQVTPVWHLSYVGFIVAALSAVPLGHLGLARAIFIVTAFFAAAIWGVSAVQLFRRDPPPPLRPLLAIHLAPAALLGTVAQSLGYSSVALVLAGMAIVLLAALLAYGRYITAAGFSPLWGSFTFPLAAFSSLMLALAGDGQGEAFRILGGITLVAGTLAIPAIAVKVMQAWAKGQLAARTNAARA